LPDPNLIDYKDQRLLALVFFVPLAGLAFLAYC
jgi:hypothetical protein